MSSPIASSNKTASRSNVRWVICALLFFATVIAYVDRSVLSQLEKMLEGIIPGLTPVTYGHIIAGFQMAYAIGLLVAGGITDKLGTRLSFALSMVLWSIAAMLPGAAHSVMGLGIAMVLLGVCEAANFPACIKTVAEWFPQAERSLATALFNSGANVGTMLVPFVVVYFTQQFGWRKAFVGTGALGLVWLVLWLLIYRRPPQAAAEKGTGAVGGTVEQVERVSWVALLGVKETWAFSLGKFLTDPIWWFWLFWLPRYLQGTFHLTLAQTSVPFATVYVISIAGSLAAGWLPARLLRSGKPANFARKVTMLICALAVLPVIFAPFSHNLWVVVALVGLAAAAHQGWSANIFTIPSDVFPKAAVASVVGIGGMAGSIGGALFSNSAGYIIAWTHSYMLLFAIACCAYVLALAVIQWLSPKLAPARVEVLR